MRFEWEAIRKEGAFFVGSDICYFYLRESRHFLLFFPNRQTNSKQWHSKMWRQENVATLYSYYQ